MSQSRKFKIDGKEVFQDNASASLMQILKEIDRDKRKKMLAEIEVLTTLEEVAQILAKQEHSERCTSVASTFLCRRVEEIKKQNNEKK